MICNECETVSYCTKHGCVPKRPAPVQEPLTWLKTIETPGGFGKFVEAKPNEKGAKPVYLTPPAAEFVCSTGLCHYKAQQAVPLTEPELRAVLEKTNHMITNTMRGPFWPELEQACRAIEAAHSITAAPEKGQP
jgi:hypothetical protein